MRYAEAEPKRHQNLFLRAMHASLLSACHKNRKKTALNYDLFFLQSTNFNVDIIYVYLRALKPSP